MHDSVSRRPARPGTARRRSRAARDERGAVAIMFALCLTGLLVIGGMVLDFGLVRVDRQVDKSAADAATFAGLHSLYLNAAGAGNPHPYAGVCGAIRYLQVNSSRFSGISSTSGTWSDGNGGAAIGDGCTNGPARNAVCKAGSPASFARFVWNGTYQSTSIQVTIQSGYQLPVAGWSEDTLPAAQSFEDDGSQGCDQLGVIIRQNRHPGLGSLATSSELVSSIRTVGRVKLEPGGDAPAMILLKRTGCPVLQAGSSGGGSHVYVYGAISSNGHSQPGSIHADSDGTSCTGGSQKNIYLGEGSNGIVAFAAPLPTGYPACITTDTCQPNTSKPGIITSVAAANGYTGGVVSDGTGNVFGSGATGPSGIAAASKTTPSGRGLVGREMVDDRYLIGVRAIVSNSQSIWTMTASNAPSRVDSYGNAFTVVSSCNPSAGSIPNAPAIFVDCTANGGFTGPATFGNATKTIVFNGTVNPASNGAVSMPSATKVYIFGSDANGTDALSIGNNATFAMHTSSGATSNLSGGTCSNTPTNPSATTLDTDKATLVVKSGDFKQTAGQIQMCYTTVVMLGGDSPNGCLTNVDYNAPTGPNEEINGPTNSPCPTTSPGGVAGNGQLSQTGGNVDWTAPNQYDLTTLADGSPDPAKSLGWADANGPEDLAFWSESYGGNSNPSYNMGGTGSLHVVGVYMVPNAEPFQVAGGACQLLTNAQYIASTIALNGNGTCISMRVDANAAVQLPQMGIVGLVR